ncbi:MAG: hypothetical protein NTV63_04140 [Candidatus Woesearchaeota archaeon]|nr:hypothetical protein [Candidatus Woesearchaeota archaeon]
MNKKNAAMIFLALALILFSYNTFASLGVSPATLRFPNLLRGGFSQRSILISTMSDAMKVDIHAEGNISSWLSFSNYTINVSAGNSKPIKVFVKPPIDVPNGNYSGYIVVTRKPLETQALSTGIGNLVIMSVNIPVDVVITDIETIDCTANSFLISDAEEGSQPKLAVSIINSGNVRMSPVIRADIWDQEKENALEFLEFNADEILPSVEQQFEFSMPLQELPVGQYWAQMSVPECRNSELLTFDILKKGSLTTSGKLIQIKNLPWLNLGATAKISAIFKNDGKKDVSARFKGIVSIDGQIIKVLESEQLNIPVGETVDLNTFFKPEAMGRYVISGKVYYDRKVTYELSSILNVIEGKKGISGITIAYIAIIAISLFLLFIIFKKRRKKRVRRF